MYARTYQESEEELHAARAVARDLPADGRRVRAVHERREQADLVAPERVGPALRAVLQADDDHPCEAEQQAPELAACELFCDGGGKRGGEGGDGRGAAVNQTRTHTQVIKCTCRTLKE